ncbi:MAG: hypothetical protein RJB20_487 [Pseudomonadota bacterium]
MNDTLNRLALLLEQRKDADPQTSYVAKLYAKGMDSILKKSEKKLLRPSLQLKIPTNKT